MFSYLATVDAGGLICAIAFASRANSISYLHSASSLKRNVPFPDSSSLLVDGDTNLSLVSPDTHSLWIRTCLRGNTQLQIDGFSQIKHVYIRMSVLSGVNSVCISNLEQLVTLNVGVSCFSFFETTGIIREGEPIEFGNPKYCPKNSPKSFEVKNNPSLRSLVIGTSCFAETSLCRIAGLFVHSF